MQPPHILLMSSKLVRKPSFFWFVSLVFFFPVLFRAGSRCTLLNSRREQRCARVCGPCSLAVRRGGSFFVWKPVSVLQAPSTTTVRRPRLGGSSAEIYRWRKKDI